MVSGLSKPLTVFCSRSQSQGYVKSVRNDLGDACRSLAEPHDSRDPSRWKPALTWFWKSRMHWKSKASHQRLGCRPERCRYWKVNRQDLGSPYVVELVNSCRSTSDVSSLLGTPRMHGLCLSSPHFSRRDLGCFLVACPCKALRPRM